MDLLIRNEQPQDHFEVENLTRQAFWNLYFPGCCEHYLAHVMREHPDFVSDMDFVAVSDGKIIGNIMYTRSHIIDESGKKIDTLSFGPFSVLPEFQHKGVGTALLEHSKKIAIEKGCPAITIYGDPHNYCKHGFKCSKDMNVSSPEGKYPYGLLVLELEKVRLDGHKWKCYQSDVYNIDQNQVEQFDKQFEPKEKGYKHSQYLFSMAIRAFIE